MYTFQTQMITIRYLTLTGKTVQWEGVEVRRGNSIFYLFGCLFSECNLKMKDLALLRANSSF